MQVRDILGALIARDVDRARTIAARDDRVNRIHHRIVDDLIQLMAEDGDAVFRGTKLIMVAQNFERIGDRVTNLAEDLDLPGEWPDRGAGLAPGRPAPTRRRGAP